MKTTRLCMALGLAYVGSLALFAAPAAAQQETLERVTVTGSSIKRLDSESSLPVTVMTREDIQKSGAVSVEELMHRISAGGAMFSDATQGAGYATSNVNLRGIGANSTLVLLNGRRLANHPFGGIGGVAAVDLNSIPFAALERIEVLRDGASAVYGSDAVGGVVNFITRKDYSHGEATLRYGNTEQRKGGSEKGASLAFGYGNYSTDGFNLLVTANVQKNERLRAVDQAYYNRGGDDGIVGAVPPTSGVPYPGVLMDFGIAPGAYVQNGLFNDSKLTKCDPINSIVVDRGKTSNGQPKLSCRFIYAATLDNLPDQEKADVFARASFNLGSGHQGYVEGSYARNHSIGRIAPTPIRSDFGHLDLVTAEYPSFHMPVDSKYFPAALLTQLGYQLPAAGTNTEIAIRAVPVGNRINDNHNSQSRFVAGVSGVFSGWDYDTAITMAQAKGHLDYDGYVNEPRFIAALATGKINPFGPSDADGIALFRSTLMVGPMRDSKSTTTTFDGKISRELMEMAGGPMSLALGVDLRREKANDRPVNDDYRQGLHVGGEGSVPETNASRTVNALYSELAMPFAKGWEAGLAARYDKYSDFGSTFNPRASIRWQPTSKLMLRSSVGTGFRAPSLWDVYAPASRTNTGNSATDPECTKRGDDAPQCETQFNVINKSSPSLKAEKSKQFAFGLAFEPTKGVLTSIDYWKISKSDQIGTVAGDTIVATPELYAKYINRIHRAANGYISYIDQPIENLGGLRTSGLDLSFKLSTKVADLGRVSLGMDGTYVLNYEDQSGKDQPYKSYAGTAGDGARVQPVPRWQHTLSLDVQRDDWSVRLENTYVSGWFESSNLVSNSLNCACSSHQVKPTVRFNASGAYTGFKGFTIRLGVRNLTDETPPYVAVAANGTHAVGWSSSFADPRDRFWYGSVTYQFK